MSSSSTAVSNMQTHAIVLFDVDGTLLVSAGAETEAESSNNVHKQSVTYAIEHVMGIKGASISEINHHGMTDKLILAKILENRGIPETEIWKHMDALCQAMVDYCRGKRHQVSVLPGVRGLLDRLTSQGILLGLTTGNLETIAWEKMEAVGLKDYFGFGGFGSDDPIRQEMIKIAVSKATKKYNLVDSDLKVTHIGDAPSDIQAAQGAGVNCIGVATGIYDVKTLEEYAGQNCVVVDNLEDTDKIVSLVGL